MSKETLHGGTKVTPSAPELAVKSSHIPRRPKITPPKPRKDISTPTIALGEIPNLQILNEKGEISDPSHEPKLEAAELLRIYRAMVLTRKLDTRMLTMQRQGEMGTFAPGMGQEATQIGQIYPLTKKDWFAPSYRSFGAQLWRGWTIEGLMLLWAGFFEGFEVPEGVNDLPFSIVVGSHVPLAGGIAIGIKQRRDDAVVVTNFGDGAISQGAVNEAFNFAAVYKAPVVFVCENNGYAISMPTDKQVATPDLARRGPGFGVPAIRVDGNDVLAMIVATTEAVQMARAGDGPSLIEAVTYRMSLHTTADDPKVYRRDEEVEQWQAKCPIARFEKYLMNKGLLDPQAIGRLGDECEQEVLEARTRFRERAKAKPREVFDMMYEELPPELEQQKREYLAKLDRKGVQ
ncbi:MAG: pyruvate dehydrogenase (acetyl-transferring) E1 component subunit alpha [Planctomycetes bacterium]|nr:pyruvate dehydrogenase (acetyl-transferring) E1 component subunit alpha [Planctomycetota bacterium]